MINCLEEILLVRCGWISINFISNKHDCLFKWTSGEHWRNANITKMNYILQSHTTALKKSKLYNKQIYISSKVTHCTVLKYIEPWDMGIFFMLSWRHSFNGGISRKNVNLIWAQSFKKPSFHRDHKVVLMTCK